MFEDETDLTPSDGRLVAVGRCGVSDFHANRVEQMLKTAKTKADLQQLVRSLDARNIKLQHVRDELARELNALRKA